ncbi:MAG: S8 family peptidase [Sterolibacterium sp.]
MSTGIALGQVERNPAHYQHHSQHLESDTTARVIVKFKQDAALPRKHAFAAHAHVSEMRSALTARANALGTRLGMTLRSGRALNQHTQVVLAEGMSSKALAERLSKESDVEHAVVDQRRSHHLVPNDPLYAKGPQISGTVGGPDVGQWYLRAPSGEVLSSINATGAWDMTTGSASIVVAVIDSGVRPEHPDLAGRLLPGYNMIDDIPTSNDGGARDADPSDPGDWVTHFESTDPSSAFPGCDVQDSSWHGTLTSSLVGAASNNASGMAGMVWNVKLLPVRVLGKCGGYDSDIIAGMLWASGLPVPGVPDNPNPARVINMSLGGSGACTLDYIEALAAISTLAHPPVIVASAGNSSGQAVSSPADCPGVIAVAGLRHIGTKVGFSDLGPEITISAPGGNCVLTGDNDPCLYPILGATNTGKTGPVASAYTDSFNSSVGTSFSAPLVAGTAALMLSLRPSLTSEQVVTLLKKTARAFPTTGAEETVKTCHVSDGSEQLECYCTTATCGAGMLDVAAAVAEVKSSNISLGKGWNLVGNSVQSSLSIAGNFGDPAQVASVWKWVTTGTTSGVAYPNWAFYTPTQNDGGLAHARKMGYDFLTAVNAGEGFWVNAKAEFTVPLPIGEAVSAASFQNLPAGWHLLSIGASATPASVNAEMSGSSLKNLNTIWAWDKVRSKWYFYAPSMAAMGNPVMTDYIAGKGYLDFTSESKTLGPGVGFWVNKP